MTSFPPKRIAVLGSTGSIGVQALEVVSAFPERFAVVGLAAGRRATELAAQARTHAPRLVAICDEAAGETLRGALAGTEVEVRTGEEGLLAVATHPDADLVLAAMAGIAGLRPVLAALAAGKPVAIANKEPLVAAGALVTAAAARADVPLLPVDSEHSAIFQALMGQDPRRIRRILLTASGGPFAGLSPAELKAVTPEQALAHPTWKMGRKVTIDSATLMNKGLEMIEAHWLFGVPAEQIEIVVHPQSIVHSLVEFVDGSTLAQLGPPDMRTPIQFALGYPDRLPQRWGSLDLAAGATLTFGAPDPERFPCLRLAYEALAAGGTAPAALNAADEVAVEAFLAGRIGFMEIPALIERALAAHHPQPVRGLDDIAAADQETREQVRRFLDESPNRLAR